MAKYSPGDRARSGRSIEQVARQARRLLYAAAVGLLSVSLLGVALGIDRWPTTLGLLRQGLVDDLVGPGSLLVAAPAAAFLGTALLLRRSRRIASGESGRLAGGHLWIAGLALLYALAMALTGWQQVSTMRHEFQDVRLAQQVAVARLKARQLDDWGFERMMNLRFLGGSLRTLPLEKAGSDPAIRQLVELTLAQFLASNPERLAAGLFRPDGTPLIAAGHFEPAQAGELARQVREASGRPNISAGPIMAGGATARGLSIAFFNPIDAAAPGQASERLVVVSVLDPTVGVLKGFGDWPTGSQTSEVELLYRDGSEIVHIVPGKEFEAAAPLSLRNPARNEQLVGARAIATGHGIWDGIDHHDRRVLAASFHATAFPWIVIAKTDYREAMRPVDDEARKTWAMIVALILFGFVFSLALGAQLAMADALRQAGRDGG